MTTPTPIPVSDEPLSVTVRTATLREHREAERSPLMHDLLRGWLPLDAYRCLLVQFAEVYGALEDHAARWRDDPVAGPFLDPALDRRAAIAADLALLDLRCAAATPGRVRATDAYLTAIEQAASSAWGIVAHHYTRYLGDLSGGQVIGRVLARHYGLGPENGASFYVFDRIADPAGFKARYRSLLDALPWDRLDRDRFVAEVRRAYLSNRAVFDEVHRRFVDRRR